MNLQWSRPFLKTKGSEGIAKDVGNMTWLSFSKRVPENVVVGTSSLRAKL